MSDSLSDKFNGHMCNLEFVVHVTSSNSYVTDVYYEQNWTGEGYGFSVTRNKAQARPLCTHQADFVIATLQRLGETATKERIK